MLTDFQRSWMDNAPGTAVDPNAIAGFQCVDVPKDYVQHIVADTTWQMVWPGAGNAKDMLSTSSDAFVHRILNDPADPDQVPEPGDIIVWGGTGDGGANPFGHIAVVTNADANGVDVIQQDGFLQVPMFRARLGYSNPGTGTVSGWLRPFFDPAPAPPPPLGPTPLGPRERLAGASSVNQRSEPRLGAPIVRVIPPGSRETWEGFVRGDRVDAGGQSSPLWFADGQGSASILFFDPANVDGLPDLTPTPTAGDLAEPVLLGLDVSQHQAGADLSALPGDFVLIKASEGVGFKDPALNDFTKSTADPSVVGNAHGARAGGKRVGFYHLTRALEQPGNTVEAEVQTFLSTIRSLMRSGDVLALDWEPGTTAEPGWALEWLRAVRAATGATPLIYMNSDTVNARDWQQVEREFPLWMAAYPKDPERIEGHDPDAAGHKIPVEWVAGFRAWQYTQTGRLPRFDGDLLLDVFYGTGEDWERIAAP